MKSLLLAALLCLSLAVQQPAPRAVVEHISATATSDGSTNVYCIVKNVGEEPLTNMGVVVEALDGDGEVVKRKELLLLQSDTLWGGKRLIFADNFEDCERCVDVTVTVFLRKK